MIHNSPHNVRTILSVTVDSASATATESTSNNVALFDTDSSDSEQF